MTAPHPSSLTQSGARRPSAAPAPIPMVLHCPACGTQHVDAPDNVHDHFDVPMERGTAESDAIIAEMKDWERTHTWDNPPHRSHLCANCNHVWRPADVPTVGVAAIGTKGKDDSPSVAPLLLDRVWDELGPAAARCRGPV